MEESRILADSGDHSEETLKYLKREAIDGYVPDPGFRARDPRFKDYRRHKPKERLRARERFDRRDFQVSLKRKRCRCPAGHEMWLKAERAVIGHHLFMQFQAYGNDCAGCRLRKRCLRDPNQQTARQIHIRLGISEERKQGLIEQMKRKIDSRAGRDIYSRRLGIVEPVFAHTKDGNWDGMKKNTFFYGLGMCRRRLRGVT